jgi:thiol:disulfide interchange protein DsbD
MVALALGIWLWTVTRDLEARGRTLGLLAAILVLAAGAGALSLLRSASAPAEARALAGEPYTAGKLASYRALNRPVFVDATAAWCITCLVNEDAVLSRQSVKDAFAGRKVVYMVADWTNRNDEITQLLKENGRSGVPLYLYYAPGAASPVILSQVLTEGEVLKAMGG